MSVLSVSGGTAPIITLPAIVVGTWITQQAPTGAVTVSMFVEMIPQGLLEHWRITVR